MKLLGREITAQKVVARIEERLKERGLLEKAPDPIDFTGVEPRVDPLSFNLRALEDNADPTVGLPLETHRGGAGQLVILAKWTFRRFGQVLINETLARQRLFNGHVRDSYAQLSAEVMKLRAEVATLKNAERRATKTDDAPKHSASQTDSSPSKNTRPKKRK